MDATQAISDSVLESDEEENKEENQNKRGRPLAKLCVLKNSHVPETELPLFLGDNVLGRDPTICSLPLLASSVSKQHATICISVYRRRGCPTEVDMEALVWDLGSMNGTRKGRLKLTPNVRYALSEGDSLVLADIPCQYVSCSTHSVSSQGDMRTPGNRNSRIKTVLPDALGDTDTISKKCVSGGIESKKTTVRGGCLSFEQTPIQPKRSLVSESDSDSDSERGVRGDRRLKTQVSDSDSHKSSPSSSAFLSPPNKIVPESEDESPISPSTSTRPNIHVSFSTEKTNTDVERQRLEKNTSLAFPENSEEEEERAAKDGTISKESRLDVKQKSHVSFPEEGELLVSTPGVSLDAIPAFDMDSDTDVEGEEGEGTPAGSLSINTNRQADQPPNTVLFHMDSDTDADEDEDISDVAPKTVSNETAKPSHVALGVQFESIVADSDTDVEEEDAAVSEAIITAKAASFLADSASSRDFHLDSDTDEEEAEAGCRTTNSCSKTNETLVKSDLKPDVTESAAAPHSLLPDTRTESVCAPAAGDLPVTAALTKPCTLSAAAADLDIWSDSDTDMEEQKDSPLVTPVGATNVSASSAKMSGSDADTDLDEPHAGDEVNPADLRRNGDTDVEDVEANIVEKGEEQIPQLETEHSLGSLVPLLQNCSTPVQDSEEVENMETQAFISTSAVFRQEVENMETQAFISPSAVFRPAEASALRHVVPSSCSDSQEDEDYTVAETQSFVLQTRNQQTDVDPNSVSGLESKPEDWSSRVDSFQLGLSDSSLLQCQESTQAFVLVEERVNLEETQAYISTDTENDSHLEAKQAFEENEEPVKVSDVSAKEGCVNLAFEATQAYISEPYDNPEKDSDEDERQNPAVTETADNSSTLAMAETQPVLASEDEGSLQTNNSIVSVHVKPKIQNETKEKVLSEVDFNVKTQPTCTSDKENNDEDSSVQLEEEQTQPYACSLPETQPMHVSVAETQPVVLDEDYDEHSMPLLRKRKAKQLHIEEEKSQQLRNSDACAAETQPVVANQEDDDDDDESMPGFRKRKAKPLQLDDETQSLGNSEVFAVGTQPSGTCEDKLSNEENFSPCPQKRKTKPLQVQEEQTRPLIGTQVSGISTQPEVGGEEEENDSEVFVLPRKKKAKQLHLEDEESQQLTASELSTAQTQLTHENEGDTIASPQIGETLRHDEEQTQPLTSTEVSVVETQLNERDEKSEDSIPGPQRKTAKQETKSLCNSEASSVGTLLKTKTEETNQSIASNSRQTRSKLIKEKEEAECSAPPRRQTRKESKTLPKTRGRRGKARPEDGNSEEEVTQTRGRVITRQREGEEEKEADDEQQEEVGRRRRGGAHQNKGKLQMEDAERVKPHLESVVSDRTKSDEKRETERLEVNLEMAKKEQKVREMEKEHQTGLETEKKAKEKQLKDEEEEKQKVRARGRRSTRKASAIELEQSSSVSTSEDFPARRTRSRSNSSNSISSERSASSANTQASKRIGGVRSSETLQTPISRSSRRRVTVAAGPVEQNSPCSHISSFRGSCQNRAKGGQQQGRGRKTSDCHDASSEIMHKNNTKGSDSQPAGTSRGQQRVNTNESKPSVLKEEDQSSLEKGIVDEKSLLPKKLVRGRGQKAVQTENVEKLLVPSVSDADEGRNKRNRTKTDVVSYKVSRVPKTAEEEEKDEQKNTIPAFLLVRTTGRASCTQMKNGKESLPEEEEEDGEKKKVEAAEKKSRGRASTVQKNKKEELKESGTSASSTRQNAKVETSKQPQTPTSNASRKRQASSDSSPLAKTPRSSSGSPAASCRLRAGSQAYKVLFTGVVDEEGERVLTQLGGGMAKGVADMNCLVTDKVRRTVKFLCAVAKGVPVVTTDWLAKSGKAGSFLPPNAFVVKDPEQEKKFNFCLQDSLKAARSQLLLQGYKIHVTKSVQPEPVHMKEIICCSGAVFLPKMPSSQKPQTVVISCEEDWRLCGPAVSASLPVVTAEFILTGILQQKLDFQNHALSLAINSQPAGDRGRSKRKTAQCIGAD